jgi:hypothetical protein
MSKRSILFAAVGGALAVALAAGCTVTTTATASPYANCTQDPAIPCQIGEGWRCAANTNPEDEVANLSCSIPVVDGPDDDFCCIAWTYGSTCRPDPNVICPNHYSYGYSCLQNDDPATYDPSLTCSSPVPDSVDPTRDDFCCW